VAAPGRRAAPTPMVKDGYWYGLPLLLIAAGLLALHLYVPSAVFLVLTLFVLNFFRDPEREIPQDPDAITSPADGKVVQVVDETYLGRPVKRLSIFMSPLDVHVNRAPIAGTLTDVAYQRGSFLVASGDRASVENEQNIYTIQGNQGTVVSKQIAGALARRIVFWKRPGDRLERGERVGLIKFGSRVDVIVDQGTEWRVKSGDRVRAGSSILAITKRQP
ncbi:MAG TPA: phosphatidylserine decarboxylase, partial [Candidatus Methylomirabilis sp.]|nr:phosphatidylserine decarboxylase [Candidatus Methylomirabilis sp.]